MVAIFGVVGEVGAIENGGFRDWRAVGVDDANDFAIGGDECAGGLRREPGAEFSDGHGTSPVRGAWGRTTPTEHLNEGRVRDMGGHYNGG